MQYNITQCFRALARIMLIANVRVSYLESLILKLALPIDRFAKPKSRRSRNHASRLSAVFSTLAPSNGKMRM